MPYFVGRKSRGAFWQPAFFLAGNRTVIVVFEKGIYYAYLANDCSPVLKF